MGGASSKSTTNLKTKLVVEALTRNIMNCSTNASAVQRTLVSGDYNVLDGIDQVMTVNLSADCIQDASTVADVQQSVREAIKNSAEAQSVTLTGILGSSDSEVSTFIDNEVRQTITQQNITNIINKVNIEQELVVAGNYNIIKNFRQDLTSDLIFQNSQKLVNKLKSVQAVETDADSSSTATQKGFVSGIIDSIGNIIDNIGMMWLIAIVVAAAVIYGLKDTIMQILGFAPAPTESDMLAQPAYQPVQQPAYQPMQQPAYQPMQQPAYQPVQQPAYQPMQPVQQPAYQPMQPVQQPAYQPVQQPMQTYQPQPLSTLPPPVMI